MAITGIMRPGFVQIRVLDMDAAIRHYRDVMGLDLVCRGDDGRAYLKAYDEFDHHSIVLREADEAGMDCMGWKCVSEADVDTFAKRLTAAQVEVTEIPAGEMPAIGRRIAFRLPTGHRFDLYATIDQAEDCPETENPHVWQKEPRGMRVLRFDHCLLYGSDVEGTSKLLRDVLDLREAEKVVAPDGNRVATFLTAGSKAHDVAFVHCPDDDKFHHASFLLRSWDDIGHAADLMVEHDVPIDIGPTRHGITRGQTIYFFDPSGNRNETFCGGYTYYPDTPVRTWEAEQLGKAIFYYERALNERFLSVVT